MAISLNDHESRIKALESKKIGQVFPDWSKSVKLSNSATNYNPPSHGFISFDLFDNSSGKIYIEVNGTRYYQAYDERDIDGHITVCLSITTTDRVSWYYGGMFQQSGIGVYFIPSRILTIYYIVRYNIYKLMQFLSHLNTKFGGERR